ncbi:hypothetical protein ACFY93_01860 [Streptomyces sp. NPDC008313]|uniref:hypothetical protein n=1 Tax=Streptomyces sp. NPDC008313 TaxID=3364826 RepID=UPI0036EC8869
MLRHEIRPGKLVAGLFLACTGVVYAGDAGGWWTTPWFTALPLVVGGLSLAGATGAVSHAIRSRRPSAQDGQPPAAEKP